MNEIKPNHIAIIMDGNGRWAEAKGLPRFEGHRAGLEAVRSTVAKCLEKHISVLSLFAFSSENWRRPTEEVEFLMQLFMQAVTQEISELHQKGVALRFIGSREELSLGLQKEMQQAEETTRDNSRLLLNIVINYGGQWDILQAAKAIAEKVKANTLDISEIDDKLFESHLSTKDIAAPDLFIRTSGEQRISNFFLWQLAYTELYFPEVFWPDFLSEEFEKALQNFAERERRFGKTSNQIK